jgi:hypothetical protein
MYLAKDVNIRHVLTQSFGSKDAGASITDALVNVSLFSDFLAVRSFIMIQLAGIFVRVYYITNVLTQLMTSSLDYTIWPADSLSVLKRYLTA